MKTSPQYQEIQKLLQCVDDQIEEFFSSPYRSERVINFLNGKSIAYKNVLSILEKEKEKE